MANWPFKYIFPAVLLCLLAGCGDITGDVASLTVTPSTASIGVNQTSLFYAIATNSAGQNVAITATWSVSGNIGSITQGGFFTAGASETTGEVIATYGSLTAVSAVAVTSKGWLKGVVRDDGGNLIYGLKVSLKELSGYADFTTADGKYLISLIPSGTYEVDVAAGANTAAASAEVTITPGSTKTQDFTVSTLTPTSTAPSTTLP